MKNRVITIFFFAANYVINAQYTSEFDANNIRAKCASNGILFHDIITSNSGFEVPIDSGKHTIFSAGLWLAGKDMYCDTASDIYANVLIYNNSTQTRPGPIMDSVYYNLQAAQWNYVWKVNKTDIINHIANYNQPGYIMPNDISTWPAHGDTTLGQAQYLAPFIDTDLDGLYNPVNGDYPAIKGDQSLYIIYNDDFGNTGNMKTEIHIMLYGFNCPADTAFNNTLFIHYKIFNRSTRTYCKTYTGMFVDFDLGDALDDFIGTDAMRSTVYCYNGDNFDQNNGLQTGYGLKPPAQGVTLLKGPLLNPDSIDNPFTANIQNAIDSLGIVYQYFAWGYADGIIDNERSGMDYSIYFNNNFSPLGYPNPGNNQHYYNYLTGKWLDNTDMYFGGYAHITSTEAINCGLTPTKYIYTGDVNAVTTDPLYWSTGGSIPTCYYNWNELSSNNISSDRRILFSSGNFTFYPQNVQDLEYAFVYGRDLSAAANNFTSIQVMQRNIDSVKQYYYQNQTPCGDSFNYFVGTPEMTNNKPDFKIYPNPGNDVLNLELPNGFFSGENIKYTIYDISGKEIYSSEMVSAKQVINIEFLSNAMYYITLRGNLFNITKKFIIQH